MKTKLLFLLVALVAFKAGAAFDRWEHRPIVTNTVTVEMPDSDVGLNDSGSFGDTGLACEFTWTYCWKST